MSDKIDATKTTPTLKELIETITSFRNSGNSSIQKEDIQKYAEYIQRYNYELVGFTTLDQLGDLWLKGLHMGNLKYMSIGVRRGLNSSAFYVVEENVQSNKPAMHEIGFTPEKSNSIEVVQNSTTKSSHIIALSANN